MQYTAKTPKPGSGLRLVYCGDTVKVSYDKPRSGLAQDGAMPRRSRQAHDYSSFGGPEEPEENPVQALLELLNANLDEETAQQARDLLAQFVDLEPAAQNGGRQAQDSAVRAHYAGRSSLEQRFGSAVVNRLKYSR